MGNRNTRVAVVRCSIYGDPTYAPAPYSAFGRTVGSTHNKRVACGAFKARCVYRNLGACTVLTLNIGLDQDPLTLDDWVEILYKSSDIPETLSGFSRFLAMLAVTQDVGEYIRATRKFPRLPKGPRQSQLEWTRVLSKCYDRLSRTPCLEKTWPLHRQLISEAYHCTMISIQVTCTDLYSFVGFKASGREVDVTRYRLSTWMMEQPESIQVALVHAIQIMVQTRIKRPKTPHAALAVCIAVLTIWAYIELKIGSIEMELGRCTGCKRDTLSSIDHCCLKGVISHELSDFELDLIRGNVQVDSLLCKSFELLKTIPFWQLSKGVVAALTYHYQITRGLVSSATL